VQQQQQQPQAMQGEGGVAASMAATAAAPVPTHTPQLELTPLSLGADGSSTSGAQQQPESWQQGQQFEDHASSSYGGQEGSSSSGVQQQGDHLVMSRGGVDAQQQQVHVAPAYESESENASAQGGSQVNHRGPQYASGH